MHTPGIVFVELGEEVVLASVIPDENDVLLPGKPQILGPDHGQP